MLAQSVVYLLTALRCCRSQATELSEALAIDDACDGSARAEGCSVELLQARAETQGEESDAELWRVGLAHDGRWTGGMCMLTTCHPSRGPTICHHFRCLCAEGLIAAGGKCWPKSQLPQNSGNKRTGKSCRTGYCSGTAQTCFNGGNCFCLEGYQAQRGQCVPELITTTAAAQDLLTTEAPPVAPDTTQMATAVTSSLAIPSPAMETNSPAIAATSPEPSSESTVEGSSGSDPSCSAAPGCAALGLAGDCCPNAAGVRLGCCP
eukprot:TRINITY_DN62807_c0_g1_i1.p1 TRINITY_DN62807_c0_g1~~TRINITY_DN62807_c0_g1_i1.p1  ORF type:complete len:276 (-),score=43.55 TRINITY_DN62807_c0_g1_i1:151-939(-)